MSDRETGTTNESLLAAAVQRLCQADTPAEVRRNVNIATSFATGLFSTVGLLVSARLSLPLFVAVWAWCALFALYFLVGRLPALLGFGAVTAMFEDAHRDAIDGPLTRIAKTMGLKR